MENKDLCRDAPLDQFCIFMDPKSFLGWKLVLYHISAFWDFRISCCLVVFLQPPGGALSQLSGTAVAAEPTGQGRVLPCASGLSPERLLRTSNNRSLRDITAPPRWQVAVCKQGERGEESVGKW